MDPKILKMANDSGIVKLYRCSDLSDNLVAIADSTGNPLEFRERKKYYTGIIIDSRSKELIPCYKKEIKPEGQITLKEWNKITKS